MNFERYLKYLTMSKGIWCNFSCRNSSFCLTTTLKCMEMNSCAPNNVEIIIRWRYYMNSHIIWFCMGQQFGLQWFEWKAVKFLPLADKLQTHETSRKRDQCLIWASVSMFVCYLYASQIQDVNNAQNSNKTISIEWVHEAEMDFQSESSVVVMRCQFSHHSIDFGVWQILYAWWANN